jgi:hypothetical protein
MRRCLYNIYKAFEFSFTEKHKKYYKGKEKTGFHKLFDQIIWLLKERRHNNNYYLWGLNIKGNEQKNYFGKRHFEKLINKKSRNIEQANNGLIRAEILTKDKFYATSILENQGIPIVRNLGLISNGYFHINYRLKYPIELLFEKFTSPFLVKNTILEYNEGILFFEVKNDKHFVNGEKKTISEIFHILNDKNWVIQKPEISSKQIRLINKTALNTTRIVTLLKNGQSKFLGGFQAFATNNQKTDSWGKGAIYVGFDHKSEKLKKKGFYHPSVNNKGIVYKHPDNDTIFDGYKIDGLKEAVELCKKAHLFFYYSPIIAWDVAITDKGPKILEANEKPGMNALQAINSNIKKNL